MRTTPVVITIPGELPPSINRLRRMHWAVEGRTHEKFARLLLKWATTCRQGVRDLKAWKDLHYRVRIEMDIYTPQLYDPDNLSSLAKLPLDEIVRLGWLGGDSPKYIEFEKPQQHRGPKSFTLKITVIGKEAGGVADL